MKIATDPLLFVFADLDDLFFESLRVFKQRDARVGRVLFFAHPDPRQADEQEESKADRDFPSLHGAVGIRMPECKIGPRPEHAGQTGNDENAFVVTEPDGKNDRRRVEKDQGNLMTGCQVEPTDCEKQCQCLDEGKRR